MARGVYDDLHTSSISTYRGTNTYTKANVRKLLDGDGSVLNGASGDIATDRAGWVQEGIPLHEELIECLFCGQPLTQTRKDELTAHFDDSLTSLQREIDTMSRSIQASVDSSQSYRDSIPTDGLLYPELAGELREARTAYLSAHDEYARQAKVLLEALASKRSNPFQNPSLPDEFEFEPPSTAALDAVVKKHQQKSDIHIRGSSQLRV